MIDFERVLPFWSVLNAAEQEQISRSSREISYAKGFQMHDRSTSQGVMFVVTGQLRIFIVSEEGREVTLFRVFPDDMCVVAAVGLLDAIAFEVMVDVVEDTAVIMIPVAAMSPVVKRHAEAEAFLYRTATSHFSDMVWTVQQILFLSIDRRIAQFLWEEVSRSGSLTVTMTHDEIARYIGSAREVVTKMLKYFQSEGVLTMRRGRIQITDKAILQEYL